MNKSSLICRYIDTHRDTWETDFDKMSVRFKKDDSGLCIFKYNINADFSNPLICEARGIIIDLNSLEVVCWPFNKFFNIHEQYAAKLNWSSISVQEKMDGSLIKLFYNPLTKAWQWATNGVINANDASYEAFSYSTYQDLINHADNISDINFEILNKDLTYLFEIVDPFVHPVKYPNVHLYHIGTKSNIDGIERNIDIGVEKPKVYLLNTLEEIILMVEKMNKDLDNIEHEGVVVVDNSFRRVKIKNTLYLEEHYLSNGITTKTKVLEIMKSDDIDINKLLQRHPQYKPIFDWYKREEERIYHEIDAYICYVRNLYKLYNKDRKTVAGLIKDNNLAFVGFKALDNNKTAQELINEIPKGKYEELINEYKG